ncbi:hypothetical protein BGZ65_012682, partial [Modicella reniformis]
MSLLLAIRHPGQVSVELLSALYGPQFMQTSAFKAIEQLLWGEHHVPRIHHLNQNRGNQLQQRPQQQQQYSSSSQLAYDHSQTSEYPYHDDDDDHEVSFEHEDDSGIHNHDHHFHHLQQQDQQHQHQHHHHYHHYHEPQHQGMEEEEEEEEEENGGCKFAENFAEPSYQDSIMAMGNHILEENRQKGLVIVSGSEAEIECHEYELGSGIPKGVTATATAVAVSQ